MHPTWCCVKPPHNLAHASLRTVFIAVQDAALDSAPYTTRSSLVSYHPICYANLHLRNGLMCFSFDITPLVAAIRDFVLVEYLMRWMVADTTTLPRLFRDHASLCALTVHHEPYIVPCPSCLLLLLVASFLPRFVRFACACGSAAPPRLRAIHCAIRWRLLTLFLLLTASSFSLCVGTQCFLALPR